MLLSAVLVWLQSLAGWLAGGLVASLFGICFFCRLQHAVVRALALVSVGSLAAVLR